VSPATATSSAAEQPRLQLLRRQFRLQLVQRYAAEATSAAALYLRSGTGGTSISFSHMLFSSTFSGPRAFQQQISAVQQQQQLMLQRQHHPRCISVAGSIATSVTGCKQHQCRIIQ